MDVDKKYAVDMLKTMFQYSGEKKFTDFKIRAGGRTAHCHQAVISAKSSYFHALCSSGLREAMLDHPVLKEDDGEILDSVVQYLYLGNCMITTHNVESLLIAADFIQLRELKTKCEAYMSSNLTTGNLLAYYKLAKKTNLPGLGRKCERLSKKKFSEVVGSEWLLSLSVEELQDYLKDEALNVLDEDDVLAAVERWLSNCQDQKSQRYTEELFPCVRIQFCSPARLQAMHQDTSVTPPLRLKISEYLLHDLHGEGTGRSSYSQACRARQGKGASRKPSSKARRKRSGKKPATPGTSTARTSAAPSAGTTGKPHTPPQPSASALPAGDREEILIVGGLGTGGVWNKNIFFLERDPSAVVSDAGTILTDNMHYSVCAGQDSLIFSGGYDSAFNRSSMRVQIYNINGNFWTNLPNLPHYVDLHGSALIDGNFYTIGGSYRIEGVIFHKYSCVHRLHIQSATWSECDGLLMPLDEPGIATVEEDIMVVGGWTDNGESAQTCRYNTTSNKMVPCQPMPRAGSCYRSIVAKDHTVFVLSQDDFFSYDVRTDQWSELRMPMKLRFQALALKQHKLIAMGGQDTRNFKKPSDCVQVYNISENKWSLEDKTMPLKLTEHWVLCVKLRQ